MGHGESKPEPQYQGSAFHGKAIDEALRLLSPHYSFEKLKTVKSEYFKGPLTWAKLADGVGASLGEALAFLDDADELEIVAKRAARLMRRLRERDAAKAGRVTKQTRYMINLVYSTASTLVQLRRLADEDGPSVGLEDGGRALALPRKCARLKEFGGNCAFARRILEKAVGRVLASDVHGGVKSLYFKALARWPAPSTPTDEEKVEWDDDF